MTAAKPDPLAGLIADAREIPAPFQPRAAPRSTAPAAADRTARKTAVDPVRVAARP